MGPALLIGAVSNLDNLGAGIAFGFRGTRIAAMANLIVAAMTMAATAAALAGGRVVSELLPAAVAAWLGPSILIAIGIATVLAAVRTPAPRGLAAPRGRPELRRTGAVISGREVVALGAALSINNLGTGVGAGLAGIPVVATTVSAGLLSLACVGGGAHVGSVFARLVLGRHAPLVAGVVLLAVGAAMLPGVS